MVVPRFGGVTGGTAILTVAAVFLGVIVSAGIQLLTGAFQPGMLPVAILLALVLAGPLSFAYGGAFNHPGHQVRG